MIVNLIPTLPLIEGETVTGYVSRTAQLFETTPRDFCSDLGMRWPFLCSGRSDQFDRLAWLLGRDVADLTSSSIRKINTGHYFVGKARASTAVLRRTAVRFCPHCVVEARESSGRKNLFQRLEWTIMSQFRCHRHGCQLVEVPRAKHSHATYDFASCVLRYWGVVERLADTTNTMPTSAFEEYCRRRILDGPIKDWLAPVSLGGLHSASLSLGVSMNDETKGRLRDLPIEELRARREEGFATLVKGRSSLTEVLSSMAKTKHLRARSIKNDMGHFFRHMKELMNLNVSSPILDATRSHIFSTYAIPAGQKVLGELGPDQTIVSFNVARQELGMGAEFLKSLLRVIYDQSAPEANRRTSLTRQEMEKVREFWAGLLNITDAARVLNIGREQVKGLQDCGVLSTVRISSTLRYLRKVEVDALLSTIDALPPEISGEETLPIKEFCREKGIPLVRMIQLLSQGHLNNEAQLGDGRGIQRLQIKLSASDDRERMKLARDLTLRETAKYLRISVISIRALRDNGYLKQIQMVNPDTRHRKNYITRRSIKRFERRYVTLGQLAGQQGPATIHLARRLDGEGIDTVSCGGEFVRVYERVAVAGVVWEVDNAQPSESSSTCVDSCGSCNSALTSALKRGSV